MLLRSVAPCCVLGTRPAVCSCGTVHTPRTPINREPQAQSSGTPPLQADGCRLVLSLRPCPVATSGVLVCGASPTRPLAALAARASAAELKRRRRGKSWSRRWRCQTSRLYAGAAPGSCLASTTTAHGRATVASLCLPGHTSLSHPSNHGETRSLCLPEHTSLSHPSNHGETRRSLRCHPRHRAPVRSRNPRLLSRRYRRPLTSTLMHEIALVHEILRRRAALFFVWFQTLHPPLPPRVAPHTPSGRDAHPLLQQGPALHATTLSGPPASCPPCRPPSPPFR
mmetsp:Transcript_8428/g.19385  ORF Transcript_8428/g.19385 Transcript_8428/m.19385 type:complete len:282 (+) Transcript_8428:885-1730(+)